MSYAKKSLKVSLIDAIVVSIPALLPIVGLLAGFLTTMNIVAFVFFFFPLFLLFFMFFISSLIIAKSSKKEPISVFLYPFLKTDELATLKTPFILSLIACIVLFYSIMGPFGMGRGLLLLISFPIMRAGLIFMARPETSTKGGMILLIIGTIGTLSLIIMVETIIAFFLTALSCVVIIISGCLGIREGSKYYTNELLKMKDEKGEVKKTRYLDAPFIILTMSFVLIVTPTLLLFFAGRLFGDWGVYYFILFFLFPLGTISIILNIIGMSKIGRETNPKKKLIEKILIIINWCLIAFLICAPILSFIYQVIWVMSRRAM